LYQLRRLKLGKAEREKGKRYERHVASLFREYGFEAHRGVQYQGGPGSPDVVLGCGGLHIEAKHVNKLNIQNAMDQSVRDSGEDELPCVIHHRDDCDDLVTMRFHDWVKLFVEYSASMALREVSQAPARSPMAQAIEATERQAFNRITGVE
jgi:hypothetical protein